jgi:hypothetical protein
LKWKRGEGRVDIWFFSKQTLIFNCSFIFSVVILVFVLYPIWLLGIVFLRCMLKARSKTLWLSYNFSSKYSCFPNPSIFYQSFKKNYLMDYFFVFAALKQMSMKTKSSYLIHFGLHSPSVLYSGTCISLSFHYHFTVSSVCTHYYGHGNVTSYFREQSFDFYGGGGHGI